MAAEPPAGGPALRSHRTLSSTYRVQLSPAFTFDDAAEVAAYLADLGISHLYASPVLQAAPGSTHGYDVVDHHRVNAELGGEAGHARMCEALAAAGLGQVLDVVPNHMAIGSRENAWWWDVLENGPASVFAAYFDVDWDPPESKLRHTVLLPILGDHYGRVLEAGDLEVRREGGSFTVHYFDHVVPVAPRTIDRFLVAAAEDCGSAELESVGAAFGRLPPATATDRESVRERHRDKEVLRARLADLCDGDPALAAAVDARVEAVNADWDALDALLDRQNYRLAYWRTAGRELDYRRFFDINTLVGVRVEDPLVFDDTHALVLGWVEKGVVDGLRIDHPDGLLDPEGYLARLRDATGGVWVVVEKILESGERLPETWPVAGTTGYDFLARVGGLFVDPAGREPLLALYGEFTGSPTDFDEVVLTKKHVALRDILAADLNRLTGLFVQVCERHRRYRDYTRHELHEALREVVACFPVYRAYVRPADGSVSADDVAHVEAAVAAAAARRPEIDAELFTFLADLLLLRRRGDAAAPGLPTQVGEVEADLVARFQQLTGPVMAKGVEDTAFYDFVPLVSLNEVGGSPGEWGTTVDEFHRGCDETARLWPQAMLATSTHDTKRSEDVRARLHLLSELPETWAEAVQRWRAMNVRHRAGPDRPDANAEYLLYQTLVGTWPLTADRALAYMEKAAKEAKARTSWIDPDPDYDAALYSFVDGVMGDDAFQADLAEFVAPLVAPGRVTSLAQTLVRLTAPGVPDTYQGTEVWDLSLVDPDNRRPVDYAARRRLLAELDGLDGRAVSARADGLPKLHVLRGALHLRRRRPEAFGALGTYTPLAAGGEKAGHVVAFERGGAAVTVVPRLVVALGSGWGDTTVEVPAGRWRNVLTGEDIGGGPVRLALLLAVFPVALLERSGDG